MLSSFSLLAALTRPYWRLLLLGACGVLGTSAMTLLSATLLGRGVADLPGFALATWGMFAGVIALRSLLAFTGQMALGRVAAQAIADLRTQIYGSYLKAPIDFYDRNFSANLVSSLTSDAAYIQGSLESALPTLARNIPTMLFALALLFYLNWQMALWLCVAGLPMLAGVIVVGRKNRGLSREGQASLGQMAVVAQESFLGLRLIKGLTQETFFRHRFARQIQDQFDIKLRIVRLAATFNSLLPIGTGVALLGGVWILQRQLAAGETTAAEIAGFGAYLSVLSLGALEFMSVYSRVEGMNGALQRVEAIRQQAVAEQESGGHEPAPDGPGLIEFDRVTFRYPEGEGGLTDLALRIEPGEVVAILGPNGAGKSTLIQLLLRLYRPQAGTIRLDGCPAETVDLRQWRRRFAVVSRDPVIFSLSVRENIGLGRLGATDAEIEAAARAVNLHEVIARLPGGYDASVGEGGVRLSSGQRQRLALARVFLQDPAVVVFDEATNSLDAEAEQAFSEALAQWAGSRTILLISHQLQEFWPVSRVVRLEAGRLREDALAAV
jgi:ATP-binding cassette subfamily B protein